jgi:chemotaxis protein methyltransferase CheR
VDALTYPVVAQRESTPRSAGGAVRNTESADRVASTLPLRGSPSPARPPPRRAPANRVCSIALVRDLEFDEHDLKRICALIYERAGIVLAEHKRDMVYSRVGRRVRHLHLTRFSDYLAQLEGNPRSAEWEAFTNALTTNLPSFFREEHHFPLLARHVAGRAGPVRVWCAAASTGQEPYSIAMQLVEALGERADVRVFATDIDTQALEVAARGVYPLTQIDKLDEKRRKRFFQKGGGQRAGYVRVRPELAARVTFQPLNLVAANWPRHGPYDAVFCRNVMIYFDTATQAGILKRFVPYMKPDALLFAGHSENFSYISDQFRLRGQTIYTLR